MLIERRRHATADEVADALRALDGAPHRVSARAWPGDLTDLRVPGLYSWWVNQEGAAMLTEGLELPVEPGRIYAGQTGATKWPSGNTGKATLRSRIGSQHVRGRIRGSTFRLTLASSLHRSLGLVPLGPRRLGDDSERLLTEWIMSHLDLAVHPYADPDPLADLEHQVLLRLDPPLNLDGMPRTPVRLRLAERRAVLAAGVPQSESEPTTCANSGS